MTWELILESGFSDVEFCVGNEKCEIGEKRSQDLPKILRGMDGYRPFWQTEPISFSPKCGAFAFVGYAFTGLLEVEVMRFS